VVVRIVALSGANDHRRAAAAWEIVGVGKADGRPAGRPSSLGFSVRPFQQNVGMTWPRLYWFAYPAAGEDELNA